MATSKHKTLRLYAKGTEVKQLQNLLNKSGKLLKKLTPDGDFGKRTKTAVEQFQRASGLSVDGVAGPNTWKTLLAKQPNQSTTVTSVLGLPDTSLLNEDERYGLYSAYVDWAPGNVRNVQTSLDLGMRVILGLRVETNTRSRRGRGTYDDRIVIIWQGKDGGHVREFQANTEPSSRYEDGYEHGKKAYGGDADSDGVKDLGRIPEGIYLYAKDNSSTYGNILRPTHHIRAERDSNHDGLFNSSDRVVNERALDSGRTMLFHKGGRTITGSAGCQTFHPDLWSNFWSALGSQTQFYYVLLSSRSLPSEAEIEAGVCLVR